MINFWEDKIRKQYLFADTYNIDTTILRFRNWFVIEYEVNLTRSYSFITPTGDGNYEQETTSEDDYLSNQENNNYFTHINYQDLIERPDYGIICKEFETIINDSFIHDEQNLFLEFAQKSIDQSQTDGQAKSLLKSILRTLNAYSKEQATLLTDGTINQLQEIIAEAYSFSYWETLKTLVRRYDNIYDQIIEPFKESKPDIKQSEPQKEEKHNQIFAGNAFYLWERLREHFKLQDSSRADFRFMFDAMQHDGYIHNTVSQKGMLNWVNDTYEITIGKPRYEDFKTDTKRIPIYSMIKAQYQELDK